MKSRHLFISGVLISGALPAAVAALASSWLGAAVSAAAACAVAALSLALGLIALGGSSPLLTNRLLRISSAALRPFQGLFRLRHSEIERMIVSINNEALLRRAPLRPRPSRVLLLLPHCLQRHECEVRLQSDASACRRCGRCSIGTLSALAEGRGMALAIATGGTSARKAVRTVAPDLVVAVACPRDLSSGILDAWPVPAWGELNGQPFGECYDTTVDDSSLSGALDALLD